ncbi:MAG: hypothetical protein V2I67_01295 [Thermoanaerobaculales bacterium]|jgi:anti-sigma factor RsiW|nr:hypothetical protein [Thermoanaerobaculales bacterium]
MNRHLNPEEITAVAAGLEIDDAAQRHLDSCVACRAEVERLDGVIDARRAEIVAEEPDWAASKTAVMDRLPESAAPDATRKPRWVRPALAAAAAVVVAVGLGVLRPENPVDPTTGGDPAVEEILAEMDELLSDDGIPGFEIIDPESGDLEAYFDNGAS